MSILPIYLYGNDVLKKVANPIEKITSVEVDLIKNMFETMRNSNGIGLAANQIGVLKQILVVDISSIENHENVLPMVVINPKILNEEGESVFEEGCLSIPEIREDILRPEKIYLEFQNAKLEKRKEHFDGLLARVLQHEIDHLNGILFIDYLSSTKKTLIKSKLRKISKGDLIPNYPIFLG